MTSGLTWESHFTAVWPEVRRRVVGLIVRRGTAPESAEDVAQEVAVRAYNATPSFGSADELFWWCSTVARRIVIDDHRKHDRVAPVAEPPDSVDERCDPQSRYEHQELLRAVLEQFAQLPAAQQAALAHADNANDYVRRHRARRRLLAVVEAFGAAIGTLWRRLRVGRHAAPVLLAVTIVAVLLDTAAITPATPVPRDAPRMTDPAAAAPSSTSTVSPLVHPTSTTVAAPSPGRRLTLDPPVQARISAPTPAGLYWAEVTKGPATPRLTCVRLGSIGKSFCIDYPRLP